MAGCFGSLVSAPVTFRVDSVPQVCSAMVYATPVSRVVVGSWLQTRTPSADRQTEISRALISATWAAWAYAYAVISGQLPPPPRCAM